MENKEELLVEEKVVEEQPKKKRGRPKKVVEEVKTEESEVKVDTPEVSEEEIKRIEEENRQKLEMYKKYKHYHDLAYNKQTFYQFSQYASSHRGSKKLGRKHK